MKCTSSNIRFFPGACLLLALFCTPAWGAGGGGPAPGSLDGTFGSGGKVITDLGNAYEVGTGVAVQTDGKIIVVGSVSASNTFDIDLAVVRYTAAGILDGDFGTNGVTIIPLGATYSPKCSVVIQSNGGIIVGCSSSSNSSTFSSTINRLTSTGVVDSSFGSNGVATTNINIQGIGLQGDQIIIGGTYAAGNGSDYDFAAARYTPSGVLDTSFGTNGLATADFNSTLDYALAMAMGPNNEIVVSGFSYQSGTGEDFAIARFTSNGVLDTSFDGDGKITTNFGTTQIPATGERAYAVAVQTDGKIVAAGSSTGEVIALARYKASGGLDTSFDRDGKVTTAINNGARANAVVIQPDGKIVVGGLATVIVSDAGGNHYLNDFALVRYTSTGGRDSGFGNKGVVTTQFTGRYAQVNALALQTNGKIIAAGQSYGDFSVARYNP
ncbi:MAG: hypothetical protein Q7S51_08765 [Gallionellaceae bacterium]|nr:hypothetical protein [Gallionellaceae bacterium]